METIAVTFGKIVLNDSTLANLEKLGYTADELRNDISFYGMGPNTPNNVAVYVGTYGKYAGGSLQGLWLDLTSFTTYQEFIRFCRALHCDEINPEIMIQDYMNCPKEFCSEILSEESFQKLIAYSELCLFNSSEAVSDFLENFDGDDLDAFEDHFEGYFETRADFAYYWVSKTGKQDEIEELLPYLDYSGMAENMFACDYYMGSNGYVFRR